MALSLTTIVDGTSAEAADVNQYKTAIELIAGAGWNDGAGDLYLEECSDKIRVPGDGLQYTGGNLQADVSDFAGTGLEDDGSNNLRIAAAAAGDGLTGGAGSALAVNVGTGLEISSDAVRIAAAAAGAGLTGGAGSALDVNVEGTTIEIYADYLRIASGAAGAGLTGGGGVALAVNPNTSNLDILSDQLIISVNAAGDGLTGGGGSPLDVLITDIAGTGLEDDGSNNLRIAAAAAGDGLTGGGGSALAVNVDDATIEIATDVVQLKSGGHNHTQWVTIFVDNTASTSDGVDAATLPQYDDTNHGTTGALTVAQRRFVYYQDGETDTLEVRCDVQLSGTPAGTAEPKLQLVGGALSNSVVITETTWTAKRLTLDTSGQSAGMYIGTVDTVWTNSTDNSDTTVLSLRKIMVRAEQPTS